MLAGQRVRILPGSDRNIKITLPTDIVTAEVSTGHAIGERRLILADEPTGALTRDRRGILRLLRARCDAGAAGVLVTHEARHAAWADRVVFLRDGVVVDESARPRAHAARVDADRPAVRLARGLAARAPPRPRDVLRSRGRSFLVLVMIALPVLGVTRLTRR